MLVLNLMGFTCPPLTSEARARIQAKPNGLDSLEAAGSPIGEGRLFLRADRRPASGTGGGRRP